MGSGVFVYSRGAMSRYRSRYYRDVLFYYNQNAAAAYAKDVLATNPIAYWKLNEGSGSTIVDSSGNGYDGSYTGVTWDGTTFLGDSVPYWDGTNDVGNVYSAGLASAFDLDEGCMLIWVKIASGTWSDSVFRAMMNFRRDGSNYVYIAKTNSTDIVQFFRSGNGTTDIVNYTTSAPTDFFSMMLSWSVANDEFKAYFNGSQVGVTQTGLVASAGSGLDNTRATLGAATTAPGNVHDGYLSQSMVWDSPVDASKLALATINGVNA